MARTVMGNVVDDLTKLSPQQKNEQAEQFCEGNKHLKELLLKLWNNGIQTYACCAGHEPTENGLTSQNNPYILFEIKTLSEKQQKKLYKNLMMISRNLGLVEQFDLKIGESYGSERHGLTIRLKNDERSYEVLNDLFDVVLQKESLLDNIKKFSIKRNEQDNLTREELDFVNSLIELNGVDFDDYLESTTEISPDQKFKSIQLIYDSKTNMRIDIRDGTKEVVYKEGDSQIVFYCSVAEGMYTKDPHIPNLYYTYRNGRVVELNGSQLEGLQEYVGERERNREVEYSPDMLTSITTEIEKNASIDNSKDA